MYMGQIEEFGSSWVQVRAHVSSNFPLFVQIIGVLNYSKFEILVVWPIVPFGVLMCLCLL
jgi:hypothetical protein